MYSFLQHVFVNVTATFISSHFETSRLNRTWRSTDISICRSLVLEKWGLFN